MHNIKREAGKGGSMLLLFFLSLQGTSINDMDSMGEGGPWGHPKVVYRSKLLVTNESIKRGKGITKNRKMSRRRL